MTTCQQRPHILGFGSQGWPLYTGLTVQVALVICGLLICDFAYMRSRNDLFSGTYPLIISHPWSFYMRLFLESLSLAYNEVQLYFEKNCAKTGISKL